MRSKRARKLHKKFLRAFHKTAKEGTKLRTILERRLKFLEGLI